MALVALSRTPGLPISGGSTAGVGRRYRCLRPFVLLAGVLALLLSFVACGSGGNSGNASTPPPPPPPPPLHHQVVLTWESSASPGVIGYYVYRASASGGPYTRITSQTLADAAYTDPSVVADNTYYYVVTSLSDNGLESTYSNEASATIPSP